MGSSVAPGQFLGYSFQVSRMLEYLLRSEAGASVSLEVLGDTAVHADSGHQVVEEAKSSTSGANPVSDRSIQLWKTLRNWRRLITELGPDKPLQFRLHVLQPHGGTIVEAFSEAKDRGAATAAVKKAEQGLRMGRPLRPELEGYIEEVFAEPAEELITLVERFEYSHGTGRSMDALIASIGSTAIPPEVARDVLRGALGWVKERVDGCIEKGEPALLTCAEFWREVQALVRKLDREQILVSVAPRPHSEKVLEELSTQTYIQQLRIIKEDYDGLLRAASQYLRARSDRTQWAQSSRVHASSFDELEETLEASWANIRDRVTIRDARRSGVERGKLIYIDCLEHHRLVQGMDPPAHFIPGCFHELSDKKSIGWHPEYVRLLEGLD